MLCPSHGEPLNNPDAGIQETIRRLTDYYRFQTGNDPVESNRPYAISPHLVAHHLTTSSFYAIVSNSGKAMFIDYGSASGLHFGNFERATATTDRIRFVEHSIDRLKTRIRREIRGCRHAQPYARRPHERLPPPGPAPRHQDLVL